MRRIGQWTLDEKRQKGRIPDFLRRREISWSDQVKLTFRRPSKLDFLCTAARQLQALLNDAANRTKGHEPHLAVTATGKLFNADRSMLGQSWLQEPSSSRFSTLQLAGYEILLIVSIFLDYAQLSARRVADGT